MEKEITKLTINVSELAEYLGIGRNSAYALTRTNGFPKITIGRKILIPLKSLEAWLDAQSKN